MSCPAISENILFASRNLSFRLCPRCFSENALDDGYEFGLIDPHKHDFCESCNRIRLTAEGFLIPCLYFDEAMSIAEHVKKGDIKAASDVLVQVLKDKPKENRWSEEELEDRELSKRAFYETGG